MSKRQNDEASGDDGPTGPASKRARITPGTAPTTENPTSSSGLKNTLHGTVFQLKLLALFLLRGINAGIEFRLGTEIPGMGGKFDDLIFKFKKRDETSESYRFLQAKHKQDEEKKITAADLLQDNEKGDFSLPKYFRAYCHDIIKLNGGILPENIQECIICTNIGFDSEDNKLKNGSIKLKPEDDTNETKRKKKRIDGIELIRLDDHDNILSFDKTSDKKIPVRYRLKKTEELRKIMAGWSDVHLLAKTMLDYVTDNRQLTLSSPIFKIYHVALVDEKVIDKKGGKLCTTFLEGDNSRFREILSELTFVHYWGKIKLKHKGKSMKLNLFDETSLNEQMPKHPQSKPQTVELDFCIFEKFDDDVITKKVIDSEQTARKESFTDDFLHGINLSPEGLEFRGKLRDVVFIHYWKDLTVQLSKSFGKRKRTAEESKSLKDLVGEKEIGDFLDKLVFAVQTPNEVELDNILKNEVAKYYNLHENDFQSDFILSNILDLFKGKKLKFITSKEGIDILEKRREKMKSLSVTSISFENQNQLKKILDEEASKTTGSASKRARMTPGTTLTTKNPPVSCGLKNTLHGTVFQLKLLMLFLIRGIGAGFQFRLGTEIPGMGGKFDDLIFKFKKRDQTESYRFLQAKHKQNEDKEKITAADLLNDNDGEFSLPKYFRSYYREVIKQTEGILPETIQDCIICTNIGFDSDGELRKSGIELIGLEDYDQILTFNKVPSNKKSPTRYKLRKTDQLRKIMAVASDVHLLAKTMLDYVTDKKQLDQRVPIFKIYHVALVDEKVIDKKGGKLCTTFLEGDNSRFREILSELTFVHYLRKLKLKSDGKKKSRVDSGKKLTDFDETSLKKQLPKYSQIETQTMELNFDIFEDFYDDLIDENIIEREGGTSKNVSFTSNFLHGINLSPEGLEFRGKLRNAVFIHYWKDLTIQLSGSFGSIISKTASVGRKIISSRTASSENKSLDDLVGEKIINNFLDKLIFAVHTPNEVELDNLVKKELDDRYSLHECDLKSDFILRNMLDWFKKKESNFMTSEEGKYILDKGKKKLTSLRVTAISIDYQKQLREVLEFNDKAIEEMKDKISKMLISPDRIRRIATSLPKRTAVKVIAALEMLRKEKTVTYHTRMLQEYFQYEDSYLVTSSSRLQKDRSKFKKTLKSEHSHHLLVVACEDGISTEIEDEFYQKLVGKMLNKRIIIISQSKDEVEDKLNFGDLSDKSKRTLLEKQIDFQGTLKSVGDLIKRGDTTLDDLIAYGDLEEVINSNLTEELLIEKGKIKIRTCSSARFEPELYVERQLEHPWENNFNKELAEGMKCTTDELQKECTVDSQGYIKWLTAEDSRKKEIWKQMKVIVEKKERKNSQLSKGNLIDNDENRKGQVFIISDLAGTGKSTILFNYYEIIKRDNPDIWVIRIDLVDYSKELAEFNFSRDYQSSAVRFFANIFAKDSPFARSLLTYRFQTDGRIVIMLDGFDEIGGELHEKVFQLIKTVKLTKMDALYITTRSHLKEELQNQIFQFSYNFKNFSQVDQVACLSKYWGSKPEMSQTKKGLIQLFADSLVERLTTTLSDRESDFIGIPLQCRMLAECFESLLQDTIQKGLPIDSLIENISENDLDLANLYSLFMEKKLEIYRKEKFKADPHHYKANLSIDGEMKRLEQYLRKLAIKTIVSYPKHFNVLLGESNSFQSKEEMCQEEKDFTSGGVCFGFLDKTDKGELKFLHRTYAEYLFAKYVYAGFLPEEHKNCNNLLTSESVRKVIFMKILGSMDECKGVRVFLNSMLKERVQPPNNIPFQIEKYYHVMNNAIEETNSNILLLTCDCLDMKFSKEVTGQFIRNILRERYECASKVLFSDMYRHKSKAFERFMSCFDSNNAYDVREIFIELSIFLKNLDPETNKEKKLKFVMLVVDFLDQQSQEAFGQISQKEFEFEGYSEHVSYILNFLFSNKYYDSPLKTFLKFLSSKFLSNFKMQFKDCLVKSLDLEYREISQETFEYVLENLRILEEENKENEILKGISHHILIRNSQLFKSVYKRKEEEGDSLPINIQSLLVRDSHGMTRLHRATLRDDEKTVGRILETVRISYLSNETEAKNLGKEVLHNVVASEEKGVTPLYVAAACEHENLCQKMLIFLKEMLPQDELRKYLTDTNGFLGDALWDAMKWKKVKMFRIVLESIKKIFGQDYLIALMKAANTKYALMNTEDTEYKGCNVFSACHDEKFFNIVVEVIVDGEDAYSNLYDLLLQNWKSIQHLRRIDKENFQKILSLNGLDDFVKRIFYTDACKGMHFVVCQILDKFTPEQREQLFRIFSTENSGTKSYFARCWLDFKEKRHWKYSKEILERFSEYLGQSVVNELLVRNEYEVIKTVLCLYDVYRNNMHSSVDFMLSFLSNKEEEKIHHMMIIVLQVIEKITETSDQEGKNYHNDATRNILYFVFKRIEDCVKESDLSMFVDLISNRASTKSKEINIWIDYLVWKWVSWRHDLVDKFLKCVLDKLGPSAVEKLVRKEAVTQVLTLECCFKFDTHKLVDALLRHLSKEKREEIELEVIKNAPATLKTLIDTEPGKVQQFFMNILHLQYVTKYADRDVLLRLIDIITQPYKSYSDYTNSVWSRQLNDNYSLTPDYVDKFLLCVSDKLGKSKVKELVLHSCHHYGALQSVITSAASYRKKDLVQVMLAHLTEEDRQEIQRDHVDPACESDAESLTSSTDEEIASSSDSIDDNSDEVISNRK